eukprot:1161080-Pelagomonas_calceolata.AAC.1
MIHARARSMHGESGMHAGHASKFWPPWLLPQFIKNNCCSQLLGGSRLVGNVYSMTAALYDILHSSLLHDPSACEYTHSLWYMHYQGKAHIMSIPTLLWQTLKSGPCYNALACMPSCLATQRVMPNKAEHSQMLGSWIEEHVPLQCDRVLNEKVPHVSRASEMCFPCWKSKAEQAGWCKVSHGGIDLRP